MTTIKGVYAYHPIIILMLIFSGLFAPKIYADDNFDAREYLLKAKVLHSISHFITWPNNNNSNKFNLCVLGDNLEFYDALKLFYQYKPVFKDKNILVLSTKLNAVDNCNILFLSEISNSQLQETIEKLKNKPILICSDSTGYAEQGSHINLYVDNNKVRFEINIEASKKSGLSLSSQLLRLAKIVKAKE